MTEDPNREGPRVPPDATQRSFETSPIGDAASDPSLPPSSRPSTSRPPSSPDAETVAAADTPRSGPTVPPATPEPAATPTPTSIAGYRILRPVGRGGMGVVYLAEREDGRIRQQVAVKILKRGMDTDEVLRRFELERQVLAALNHPGIARLYDAGETDDGMPYFVMEYIEGLNVVEYCDVSRLGIDERLRLFRKICVAVHYAHQNLIVHRDLKPSNIIVTREGEPKLLDFGIAKLIAPGLAPELATPTAPQLRLMTPEYASPEQVRGDPISTASDVYSLGVVLYELVSGHHPYRLTSRARAEIEQVVCNTDPERPSTAVSRVAEGPPTTPVTDPGTGMITPESVGRTRAVRPDRLRRRLAGDIDNIVFKAMRKESQRRYQSSEQLADDVLRHLDGLPVLARPDTFGYRATKFVRRHRTGVAAAVATTALLMTGLTGTAWGWRTAESQREVAEAARRDEADQRAVAEVERALADQRFHQLRTLARTFMYDFHDAVQELDGSIPAREMLVTKALEYLDGLAADVGDDVSLRRDLAAAYDRVGDIRGGIRNPSFGDTRSALDHYRTALAQRRELLAATPDDPGLARDVSISSIRVGDMLMQTGDVSGALASYRAALVIAERLAAETPGDPVARRDLAVALSNVGAALVRTGDGAGAIEHYERSAVLREALAKERPDDAGAQRELASILLRLGGRHEAVGEYRAALPRYERAVAIRTRLAEQRPESSRWRRDLAVARYFVGRAHMNLDEPLAAQPHLTHYLQVTTDRVRDNPHSARAKRDLVYAHEIYGGMLAAIGDQEGAIEQYEAMLAVITPLAESDPANTTYQRLLAVGHRAMGETRAATGDLAAAVDHGRRGLVIAETLVTRDATNVRSRRDRARMLAHLGAWLAQSGAVVEGRTRLEASRTAFEELLATQPDDATIRTGLARTWHELSRLEIQSDNAPAALASVEQSIAIAPEPTIEMLRDLAVAHHLTGNTDRAIEVATDALARLPEDGDPAAESLRRLLEEDLRRYRGGDDE